MRITKRSWIVLACVLVVLLLFYAVRKRVYELYVLEHFDKEVPAIELQTLDGRIIDPHTFKNKVVVLDFWATWCGPCRKTFPLLEKVYNDYENNPDVAILAVNTSWNDTIEEARQFVEKNRYTIPFVYDKDSKLADTLVKPRGIPAFCILDKSGKLRIRHVGYLEFLEDYHATLKKQIEKLLDEG